jgi:hypothetical protein
MTQTTTVPITSVGPKLTAEQATALQDGYRSLNHAAHTACTLWPVVRRDAIKRLSGLFQTTADLDTLAQLSIPDDCTRDVLAAIANVQGFDEYKRILHMSEADAVVLIDLIRNGTVLDVLEAERRGQQ